MCSTQRQTSFLPFSGAGCRCALAALTTSAFLVSSLGAFAQNYERYQPKPVEPKEPGEFEEAPELPEGTLQADFIEGDTTPILESLKGLVFVDRADRVEELGASNTGVTIKGDLPLLRQPEFEALAKMMLGRSVSMADLNSFIKQLVLFYRDNDRPVVDALVPEQDITTGVIQIVVIEGRLGKVKAEGNRWFKSEFIERQVRLRPGEGIGANKLLKDLEWVNANPFRRVDLVFTPGTAVGTTDIVLKTEDRFPVRVYAGYEDSGNDLTGDERWVAGVNWGNAFFQDHQFNYQFTTSSDFNMLRAHSGSYLIPLPWRHNFTVFGSIAQSAAEIPPSFDLSGDSWQLGFRYKAPLPDFKNFRHEVQLGYDFKQSSNDLDFGTARLSQTRTDISQMVFGYTANYRDPWGNTAASATLTYSPGNHTGNNKNPDFQLARGLSESDYHYIRFQANRLNRLPWEFTTSHSFTYQLSSENLLSSEQLSVGGYSSVRGYDEREITNADEGWLMSHEFRTPPISLFKMVGVQSVDDQLQFLGFWDYASVSPRFTLDGENSNVEASSVGPGLRYSVGQYMSVRADYGFQLIDTGNTRHASRWHLGVMFSY